MITETVKKTTPRPPPPLSPAKEKLVVFRCSGAVGTEKQ